MKGVSILNQEEIGKFIAELRKEQGLTQQQLADSLGVSNKTISKWECGNGMPELSLILPLCEILGISINELLSGERLSVDGYSKKAEENIISLMKEKEAIKKNKNSVSTFIITAVTMIIGIWLIIGINLGFSHKGLFYDESMILIMVASLFLFLIAAKHVKYFFLAFKIASGLTKEPQPDDIRNASSALSLASRSLLGTGALLSVIQFASIMLENTGSYEPDTLVYLLYTASFGLIYGIICYLFFLPFKARLQTTTPN